MLALQRRALRLKAQYVGAVAERARPISLLFDKQAALVSDPSKFKVAFCGGRAGKTSTAVHELADGMMTTPHSANLYVGQTKTSAVDIFWRPFVHANELHGWGFKLNETTKTITHKNGAWLIVRGADDKRELEKRRGTPWKRVRIDECGSHRPTYLEYFVEQVIEPRLLDHDGDIWLMGTPTVQAHGYFYDVTTGKKPGWSVHRWTVKDNPHMNWQRFIYGGMDERGVHRDGLLKRRGWNEDNPIFKREYLAEWSIDLGMLVYAFERERSVVQALPEHRPGYDYILGFDFGVNNACAYSVVASPRGYGDTVYTVETRREHGMAPSQWAPIMNEAIRRWQPWKAVGDAGGLGKAFLQEYAIRYADGFPIVPANKQDRRGSIEIVSDMWRTGRKKSLACNDVLHSELATLQWDEKRENTAEGQDNDVSDADMYATKECPAFLQAATPPPPEPDEPKWAREPEEEDEPQRSYLEI